MKFRRLNPDRMKVFASFFKKKRLPYLSRASGSFLKKRTKKLSSLRAILVHPIARASPPPR
jgi:hypothetical protein